MGYGNKGAPVADRFWTYVERRGPDECWPWIGHTVRGYGRISYTSTPGAYKSSQAHRFSWALANGAVIPPGLVVRHSCDNPPCVNPAHLLLGTVADNNRDRDERGRHAMGAACHQRTKSIGETNPRAKLTAEKVAKIREDYAAGVASLYELGRTYGVHPANIHSIVRRRTWRHIP